jgi:hypothetical protein
MTIDRATFLKPIQIPREEVPMPEWGDDVTVWVYGMTAKEKAALDSDMLKNDFTGISKTKYQGQKTRTVISSVRDETGGRIFSKEDTAMISEWPAHIVERITKVSDKLNGTSDPDKLAKNSEGAEQD